MAERLCSRFWLSFFEAEVYDDSPGVEVHYILSWNSKGSPYIGDI